MSTKFTTGRAAKYLGVSQARVWKLIDDGRLPAEKDPVFGYWLIDRSALAAFKKIARKPGRPPLKT